MTDESVRRPIRSYVRREGKITRGQQRALGLLGDKYLIPPETPLDFERVFGNARPVVLEIGFGNGLSLARMAENDPLRNYLGIEVYRPGVGSLLMQIEQRGLSNLRAINTDAMQVVENSIANRSLDAALVFFPDPWHKTRHHKRRIVRPEFVDLLRDRLKIGGILHLATDWQEYAEQMMTLLSETTGLRNQYGADQFAPRPDYRPLTKFEQRGLRLGHGVWDLIFVREK